MNEVEVKILEINRKKIEEKLLALGAKKTFEGELRSVVFDDKEGSIRSAGGTLRLRKDGEKNILTRKKFVSNEGAKVREELEATVSDFGTMRSIIISLGFIGVKDARKTRVLYELEGVHFALDKFLGEDDFAPEFLEIEAQDLPTVYQYVEKLGFSPEDCRSWGPDELIARYKLPAK